MKPFVMRPHSMLLALALAVASWNTFAGVITIDSAGGPAVSVLADEAESHVDAMRLMLSENYPQLSRTVEFKYIQKEMNDATIARVEYTYEKGGRSYRRVYHARSGHSLKLIADVSLTRKDKSGNSSTTGTSDSDASAGVSPPNEIPGQQAKETIYYKGDAPEDIRATTLPQGEGEIEELRFEGISHANDAELKIVRRIDADIRNGVVSAGGEVDGFVSKTVCPSCRKAFDTLADRNDIKGEIHQLVEPEKTILSTQRFKGNRMVTTSRLVANEPPVTDTSELANSQRASIALRGTRNRYTNAQITKENLGRTRSSPRDASAIERAETSTATAEEAEACNS